VNHLDDTGRVREGFRADLAVLDRDPFRGEPVDIATASVVATFVEGAPVFEA
jgi:predicted amidohydrolase YtcJ